MSDIKRHGTPTGGGLPISKAVEADGWLYVSGQVPRNEKGELLAGSMKAEAELAFDNMVKVLETAGYTLDNVVRVGVWIDDPRDFPEFNKVFAARFSPAHAPARVTIQSSMMCDCKVEVDCIAFKAS
ncbi:RidA family protein [Desulfoluna butyratoxydans]|uniref:Endoribonuclease l-psp n=1 Tax=Desulfoluna butyratoxydans TaxID=231438 RepID=A0A4U8YQ00_9BACT|nr:RidA family protein [Desulfoluna butyratoxydans]VFQ43323.1 endoribonuclease l-psp [Desulfoluna butyratoxydans]